MNELPKTSLLDEAAAEIARLRKGLEEFANRDNWDELSIGGSLFGWTWNGNTDMPAEFARRVLEGK